MSRTMTRRAGGARDDYMDLIARFPLRPIRSDAELKKAMAVHLSLAGRATRPDAALSSGESDYFDILTDLIHKYETPIRERMLRDVTPVDRLRQLMERARMNSKALGEIVGGKSAASMILNGKREVSKSQAEALGKYFSVHPGLFLFPIREENLASKQERSDRLRRGNQGPTVG